MKIKSSEMKIEQLTGRESLKKKRVKSNYFRIHLLIILFKHIRALLAPFLQMTLAKPTHTIESTICGKN